MSAKSRKGPTKVSLQEKPPRTMAEINEDYGRLVAQAGQAQYQIFIFTEDLKRINEGLRNLNYEAAARQKLDEKAASEGEKKDV